MLRLIATFTILTAPFLGCGQVLDSLLRADTSMIVKKVLADQDKYRLQIYYTQVLPTKPKPQPLVRLQSFLGMSDKRPNVVLGHFSYRAKPDEYFFPASLVKLPVAAFALEYLHHLEVFGVTHFTPFCPLNNFQCKTGKTVVKLYAQSTYDLLHKVFTYSDNSAYNYLYELCGQNYINRRLSEMGFKQARIIEKIANCGREANRNTGPIAFFDRREMFHTEGRQSAPTIAPLEIPSKIGKGYMWNGRYIPAPKDFSEDNFLPLGDLHQMLIALYFPETVPAKEGFNLNHEDRALLAKAMSTLPSDYCPDSCDGRSFPDNHVKYLFGFTDTIPAHLKIYNKVGLAHGFISDCSYVLDTKNGVRFFVSAVLYVNNDNILNDGKYEYQSIGLPFLKRIGAMLYSYELAQKGSK